MEYQKLFSWFEFGNLLTVEILNIVSDIKFIALTLLFWTGLCRNQCRALVGCGAE